MVQESCNVDGALVNMICPSFLSIYITSGYYGRVQGTNQLCNGITDSVILGSDCLNIQVQFIRLQNLYHFFCYYFRLSTLLELHCGKVDQGLQLLFHLHTVVIDSLSPLRSPFVSNCDPLTHWYFTSVA